MNDVATLLLKADKDIKAAEVLLNTDEREYHCDVICFHCQQCIEKLLKAFLLNNNYRVPLKTASHDF